MNLCSALQNYWVLRLAFCSAAFYVALLHATYSYAYGDLPDDSHVHVCPAARIPYSERERVLPAADRVRVAETNRRAQLLADAYLNAEEILRAQGIEPNNLPEEGRSWVYVTRGDQQVLGIYERAGTNLNRIDLFGTDRVMDLSSDLSLAEQALALTPTICGISYGVVSIDDSSIEDNFYSFRLTNRRSQLAWGMNYLFVADGGSIDSIHNLHFRCATTFNRQPSQEVLRQAFGDDRRLPDRIELGETYEYVPIDDLPNEAHILQLKINDDIPFTLGLWTPQRYFQFPPGRQELPIRYRFARSPCVLTD